MSLLFTVPVVAELLAVQENLSPFMTRVGVMTKDCDVIVPKLLPAIQVQGCVFVMTALLCFQVRVAAGLELSTVHVKYVVLPLATTVVGPFNATLKDETEKKIKAMLCGGILGQKKHLNWNLTRTYFSKHIVYIREQTTHITR